MENDSTTMNRGGLPMNQTIIVQQEKSKSNGVGTAGFVLAIVSLVLCWVPVLDWILWILGLVLSFAGVFKQPRGLAIAGLCVSLIGLIILMAFAVVLAAVFA